MTGCLTFIGPGEPAIFADTLIITGERRPPVFAGNVFADRELIEISDSVHPPPHFPKKKCSLAGFRFLGANSLC